MTSEPDAEAEAPASAPVWLMSACPSWFASASPFAPGLGALQAAAAKAATRTTTVELCPASREPAPPPAPGAPPSASLRLTQRNQRIVIDVHKIRAPPTFMSSPAINWSSRVDSEPTGGASSKVA